VNEDIYLTDDLLKVYPDLCFIALVRNGYSLLDGYLRRGQSASDTGKLYSRIVQQMKKYSEACKSFKVVRFEDILEAPFEVAQELFEDLNLSPTKLASIRLKSKKVISGQTRATRYGEVNRKYWFDRNTIGELLDPTIDERQASRLSDREVGEFNKEASAALEYLGYPIRDGQ
jgi:hypothetical protein